MITQICYLKETLLTYSLSQIYIIVDKEYLFIQENTNIILEHLKKRKFSIKKILLINNNLTWQNLIQTCKKQEIFSNKIIFIIKIMENILSFQQKKYLKELKRILDKNIIYILQFPNLNLNITYKIFFKKYIKNIGLLINSPINNIKNFYTYIKIKSKKYEIYFTKSSIQNFIYINNNDINQIKNSLKIFSLLYPISTITNQILYKYNHIFIPIQSYHWINSIINSDKKKSIKILKKLRSQKYTISTLIDNYKKFLYVLLDIYNKKITKENYKPQLICKYPIKFTILYNIVKKNSLTEIYQSTKILKNIELINAIHKKEIIWKYLEILSLILN